MQPADGAPTGGVGSIIAAARQERGLTIEDVSEATRIRATLVRHIEQDDFAACGGSVYARGHIRSIARVLDIDPEPLVAAFDTDHGHVQAPLVAPPPEFEPLPHHRGEHARSNRSFSWTPLMIGSLVVVCLVAIIMIVLPDSSGEDAAVGSGDSQASAQEGTPASGAPTPEKPSAPPTSMNVRVEARDAASWLEVRDDTEQVLVQQLLERGQERTLDSERPLSIKMGDAGAVGLSCNGRDVGVPGGRGDVVTVRLALASSGDCTTASGLPGDVAAAPAPLGGPASPLD